jgi:hypothetical protein
MAQRKWISHDHSKVSWMFLCENLSEKTFQNMLKRAKIGKNSKNGKPMIPNASLTLRKLNVHTLNPVSALAARKGGKS